MATTETGATAPAQPGVEEPQTRRSLLMVLGIVGVAVGLLLALPGNPADEHARYLEADVNGVRIACIYLPNGNPQPGPKFDYKLAWMDRLHARMGDCRIVAAASQPRPAEARLACLQALHPVTLDGAAIPDPGYAVTHDPRTGRPALLAMLDIRGLAHGRHELVIGRPAREGRVRRAERDDPGHDRIVFWK